MAVSAKQLRKAGCSPKDWKPLFTAKDGDKLPQIQKLERLLANRISDGQLMNIETYRPYAAIDLAYEASFNQTTPTILQDLLSRRFEKPEEMLAQLEQWGLKPEELFLKVTLPSGQLGWQINPPTFYKILVPLVKAYVTIRQAKLFNDRNQVPLFEYEPLEKNAETRILCDILTYIIQGITADFGYPNDLKQAILQTLKYSFCLMFPREAWHTEYQMNDDGEKTLVKEGIRYCRPHPSRVFWDLHYPISSFNSNTGCEYAGYWKVVAYGEILDNPMYWNRRNIGYGSSAGIDWGDPVITSGFFQQVYPCQLKFPSGFRGDGSNREYNAAFYSTNERDKAVCQTDLFMRLVPSKWKLGTYKYPIWVRFIVASDNTVIYAEPLCYSPTMYFGYDADDLLSRNPSMALEILPYQDMVGNILSQILLTCKQNLANVHFYDKNVLNREDIDKIQNGGETMLRSMNFVSYDSMKNNRQGLDVKQAVYSLQFTPKDVNPLFQELSTTLAMMERLLQISAQEAGQAASHQQSKAEVEQIGGNTSNRVTYTGTFIDDGIDAWKKQLYDASQAYMDDEVVAMVPSDIPDIEDHLKALGFEVSGVVRGEGKLQVTGSKKAIKIDSLATTGEGPERKNEQQTAQVMMQAVQAVAANQMLAQAVGAKTILKILQQAAILAGADKDFKLRPDQKQQLDALQQMAQQIQTAAVQQVEKDVTQPVAKEIAAIQAQMQKMEQVLSTLIPNRPQQPQAAAPVAAPQPPPNAPAPNPSPVAPS